LGGTNREIKRHIGATEDDKMQFDLPLLDRVTVAAPCPASWQKMTPVAEGDRVRFCGECSLNVYNLSAMTRVEAETLLREHEGRLCINYFKRADGTIITSDCPVGLEVRHATPERRSFRALVAVSAAITVIAIITPAYGAASNPKAAKHPVKRSLVKTGSSVKITPLTGEPLITKPIPKQSSPAPSVRGEAMFVPNSTVTRTLGRRAYVAPSKQTLGDAAVTPASEPAVKGVLGKRAADKPGAKGVKR
jgi:hypothetical protein